MKRLKNSVKAIITIVCVLVVALGAVLGIVLTNKGDGGGGGNKPGNKPPATLTNKQAALFNAVTKAVQKDNELETASKLEESNFKLDDGTQIPLTSISKVYDAYIYANIGGVEDYYIKTTNADDEVCYTKLLDLMSFSETPTYTNVKRVASTYAYIVYTIGSDVNYEIIDFSNPKSLTVVKSFVREMAKPNPTEKDIANLSIDISDNLFYVLESEGTTVNQIMKDFDFSVYSYKNGVEPVSYTELSTDGKSESPFSVDGKSYYYVIDARKCFFGFLENDSFKTFELELNTENKYSYTKTDDYIFVEETIGSLGSQTFKYYIVSRHFDEVKELSLSEGYLKATISDIDGKYFSVFEQKKSADETHLEENGVMKYYSSSLEEIFHYDANSVNDTFVANKAEKILLNETGLIETTKTNVNTVKFKYTDMATLLEIEPQSNDIFVLKNRSVNNNLFVVNARGVNYVLNFNAQIVFSEEGYTEIEVYDKFFFADTVNDKVALNTVTGEEEIISNYATENRLLFVGAGFYFIEVYDGDSFSHYQMLNHEQNIIHDNVKSYAISAETFNTNNILTVVLGDNSVVKYDLNRTIMENLPAGYVSPVDSKDRSNPSSFEDGYMSYDGGNGSGVITIDNYEYAYGSSGDNVGYYWKDSPWIGNATYYYARFDFSYSYSSGDFSFSDKVNIVSVSRDKASSYSGGLNQYIYVDWDQSVCPDIDGHGPEWGSWYYSGTYGRFYSSYYSSSSVYDPAAKVDDVYSRSYDTVYEGDNIGFSSTSNCVGATFAGYSEWWSSSTHYSETTVGSMSSQSIWYTPQSTTYKCPDYHSGLLTGDTPRYRYVHAIYTPITYKIKYDYSNGTAGSTNPATATFGYAFSVSAPSRVGYTFAGWTISNMTTGHYKYYGTSSSGMTSISSSSSSSSPGSSYNYFKNLSKTQDREITLTARWTPITYTIAYDWANGGSAASGVTMPTSATFDSWFEMPKPVKVGYTFASWYITCPASPSGYPKYYKQGSSGTEYNQTYDKTAFTITQQYNYFKNLSTNSGDSYKVTFKAQWTANTYRVRFVFNNGTDPSDSTYTYDSWYSRSAVTKLGYTHVGWDFANMSTDCPHYVGSSTSASAVGSDATYTTTLTTFFFKNLDSYDSTPSAYESTDVTVTAKWAKNIYAISYDYTGGGAGSNAPATGNYDTWVNISNAVRVGYTFSGWEISGMSTSCTSYANSTNSTSGTNALSAAAATLSTTATATYFYNLHTGVDPNAAANTRPVVKFTAKWTPNIYYIVYDAGGGELGDKRPSQATFDQWFSISVPVSAPVGYYFDGWVITGMTTTHAHYYGTSTSTYQQSSTATYTAGPDMLYFMNLHSGSLSTQYTVTIAVNWKPFEYGISYDLKGGSHGTNHPSSAFYDTPFEVSNPSRKGYTFTGWTFGGLNDECVHGYYSGATRTDFTSTNGRCPSSVNANYDRVFNYSKFINLDIRGSSVLLTANWEANSYTITYYYLPQSFNTTTVTGDNINVAGKMTASKTQTVTFDMNFRTLKPTADGINSTEFPLPNGVKANSFVVSTSKLGTNVNLSTLSTSSYPRYATDTDYIYNTYDNNIYCYAFYTFAEITIKYYVASSAANRNNLAGYSYNSTDEAQYNTAYVTKSISGSNIVGWLISSNHFVSGSLSKQSYSTYTYNGTTYNALAGQSIWWIFSNITAYNFDEPVYYAYAVYDAAIGYSDEVTDEAKEEEKEIETFDFDKFESREEIILSKETQKVSNGIVLNKKTV